MPRCSVADGRALSLRTGNRTVRILPDTQPFRHALGKIRFGHEADALNVPKANLIRRQEETAATRSLLNTAKLMEDNPLLLRLKELESLERLVEKIGRVDLHASDGKGLEAMLKDLFRLETKAA